MKETLALSLAALAVSSLSLVAHAEPLPQSNKAPGTPNADCKPHCGHNNVPMEDLQDRFTNAYLKAILDQVKGEVEKANSKKKPTEQPPLPPSGLNNKPPAAFPPAPFPPAPFPPAPQHPQPSKPGKPDTPPHHHGDDRPGTGEIHDDFPPQGPNIPLPANDLPPHQVPEPGSVMLAAAALAGLAWTQLRRSRRTVKASAGSR